MAKKTYSARYLETREDFPTRSRAGHRDEGRKQGGDSQAPSVKHPQSNQSSTRTTSLQKRGTITFRVAPHLDAKIRTQCVNDRISPAVLLKVFFFTHPASPRWLSHRRTAAASSWTCSPPGSGPRQRAQRTRPFLRRLFSPTDWLC